MFCRVIDLSHYVYMVMTIQRIVLMKITKEILYYYKTKIVTILFAVISLISYITNLETVSSLTITGTMMNL